ncbi:hypothetical protein B7494_g2593 [Chlorociboria aeruginascens]|nr:hypothetical protein B7494_g2593 [Chlorociboria aeruginascens]
MAAVSAPHAATALTPPSSSQEHGGPNSWNFATSAQTEARTQLGSNDYPSKRQPLTSQTNGNSLHNQSSRPDLHNRIGSSRPGDSGYLAPARVNALTRKDSSISESGSAPDSLLDLYGSNKGGVDSMDHGGSIHNGESYGEEDPENSRWIHRDKLARIESQELQAAGIILPRTRAASKSSHREHNRDQQSNGYKSEGQKRQKIASSPTEESSGETGWDLRLPEEVAQDIFADVSGGVKGISRIPVCKTSPLPIPMDYLERDTPMHRKQSGGWIGEDEGISYSKSRGRSDSVKVLEDAISTPTPEMPSKRQISETSPTKKAVTRKNSVPTSRTTSAQRPKTGSGSNRDMSGQRPPTRSGETKRPEGDPPWLATMYKPDPRLPPDQQLLPTVAKRLQQEQWEKEGKFGTAYDTSFRPLNDEAFNQPPEASPDPEPQIVEPKIEHGSEWPLAGNKSPTLSTGKSGGYSTMPKITGAGQEAGALPSPNPNVSPVRLQEPEETKKGVGIRDVGSGMDKTYMPHVLDNKCMTTDITDQSSSSSSSSLSSIHPSPASQSRGRSTSYGPAPPKPTPLHAPRSTLHAPRSTNPHPLNPLNQSLNPSIPTFQLRPCNSHLDSLARLHPAPAAIDITSSDMWRSHQGCGYENVSFPSRPRSVSTPVYNASISTPASYLYTQQYTRSAPSLDIGPRDTEDHT